MPSSFRPSSPYISGVLLSSQTQKQGEREREREGIGKKCRFQFLCQQNLFQSIPFIESSKECVRLNRNGLWRDIEIKNQNAFKSGALKKLSVLLFLDFQSPRSKRSPQKRIFLSLSLSLCLCLVGCVPNTLEDKKKAKS